MHAQLKQSNAARAAEPLAPRGGATPPDATAKRLVTKTRVFFLFTIVMLALGYWFPTHRYISPERGAGYLLGIVGGSAMLVLLLYPLRKRFRWMGAMGSTKLWFESHVVLGIVGPLLILYHSNFSLGAANSNVALICMLLVAGSGLFGRYFYNRIHTGLHGAKTTHADLQANALRIRSATSGVSFLPNLVQRIEAAEVAVTRRCERTPILLRPIVAGSGTISARVRLYLYVSHTLRGASKQQPLAADRRARLYRTASTYIDTRLQATRRVLEFDAYERLFSLWHVLHLPLFFMLIIAGIVHVVAVHVY